jgi:hypothetical protein
MNVTPTPTDEEAVAIAAALQAVVLRPMILLAGNDDTVQPSAWRFSGRWWSRPVPVRRFRPWS